MSYGLKLSLLKSCLNSLKYLTNQCYIGVVILPKFLTSPPVKVTALSKMANKLSPDGLVSLEDIINGLCSSEYPF